MDDRVNLARRKSWGRKYLKLFFFSLDNLVVELLWSKIQCVKFIVVAGEKVVYSFRPVSWTHAHVIICSSLVPRLSR
jgi:hypothetical protein